MKLEDKEPEISPLAHLIESALLMVDIIIINKDIDTIIKILKHLLVRKAPKNQNIPHTKMKRKKLRSKNQKSTITDCEYVFETQDLSCTLKVNGSSYINIYNLKINNTLLNKEIIIPSNEYKNISNFINKINNNNLQKLSDLIRAYHEDGIEGLNLALDTRPHSAV